MQHGELLVRERGLVFLSADQLGLTRPYATDRRTLRALVGRPEEVLIAALELVPRDELHELPVVLLDVGEAARRDTTAVTHILLLRVAADHHIALGVLRPDRQRLVRPVG